MAYAITHSDIASLIKLARSGTNEQKECAAGALFHLAGNADNGIAIGCGGGIAPLIELARAGTAEQKEQAAGALRNLAFNNADNKLAISHAGYTF